MLFTCKVIDTDKIPKEIEEYSSLTHGTEFHFLINPGQSVLTQDYPRKSLKLSDTPIAVQEKRLKTLFRVLVMIGYFARVYQKLTGEHSS